MGTSSCKRLLSALYISVNGAFFQRSIHSDHMAPEHIVVLVPGGKTAAGRYCKLGEEDAPGELILGDGVFLRVTVGLLIVRQPFVGLSGELLGSQRSVSIWTSNFTAVFDRLFTYGNTA